MLVRPAAELARHNAKYGFVHVGYAAPGSDVIKGLEGSPVTLEFGRAKDGSLTGKLAKFRLTLFRGRIDPLQANGGGGGGCGTSVCI